MIGKNTKIPESKNGQKERSLKIFKINNGTHPIGEVFLIIKEIVSIAVIITTDLLNLLFTSRK